jgi:hypothetical protein
MTPDLFNWNESTDPDTPLYTRARKRDMKTSKMAANGLDLSKGQKRVMIAFRSRPPMTDEELIVTLQELGLPLTPSGARSRRAELVKKGAIKDSGQRRAGQTGNMMTVWEVVYE